MSNSSSTDEESDDISTRWRKAVSIANMTLASAGEKGAMQRAVLSDVLADLPPPAPAENELIRAAVDSLHFNATLSSLENVTHVLLKPEFPKLRDVLGTATAELARFQDTARTESRGTLRTLEETGMWSIFPLMTFLCGLGESSNHFPAAPIAYLFGIVPNVSVNVLKMLAKILTKKDPLTGESRALPGQELVAKMHAYAMYVIGTAWPSDYELKIRRGVGGYENYALELRRDLQKRVNQLFWYTNPTPLTVDAKKRFLQSLQTFLYTRVPTSNARPYQGIKRPSFPLDAWMLLLKEDDQAALFDVAQTMKTKLTPREMLSWSKNREVQRKMWSEETFDADDAYGYPVTHSEPSYLLLQAVRNGVKGKTFEKAYIALAAVYEPRQEGEDARLHQQALQRLRDIYVEGRTVMDVDDRRLFTSGCRTCDALRASVEARPFYRSLQEQRNREKETMEAKLREWEEEEEEYKRWVAGMSSQELSSDDWQEKKKRAEAKARAIVERRSQMERAAIESQVHELMSKTPRPKTNHARQDSSSGEITFNSGTESERKILLGTGVQLSTAELHVLQIISDIVTTGCGLEVLLAMHGNIYSKTPLITAPASMCVHIMRFAPKGCVTFINKDGALARAKFFLNLHTQGKKRLSEIVHRSQKANAGAHNAAGAKFSELATRLESFIDTEPIKGEFCRLVTCLPKQLFFNKVYSTDYWTTITIQNFWETKDVDLFPIMQKLGYTTSPQRITRESVFRFFEDLGVKSITFYDESCSVVSDEPDKEAEATYLRDHEHVMGGTSSKRNKKITQSKSARRYLM